MKKLMIWCTCAENNKEVYLKRVFNWYKQNKEIFKEYTPDYYVFVDGKITEEDLLNIDKELLNITFVNLLPKIGRTSCAMFQGWKRSFKTALEYGREYENILHIESDVKILHTEKIYEYLTKPGYWVGLCKTYRFIETAFMILNDKNQNEILINHYNNDKNLYENIIFEFIIQNLCKYQYVFETDRLEDTPSRYNSNYDFICQYTWN